METTKPACEEIEESVSAIGETSQHYGLHLSKQASVLYELGDKFSSKELLSSINIFKVKLENTKAHRLGIIEPVILSIRGTSQR